MPRSTPSARLLLLGMALPIILTWPVWPALALSVLWLAATTFELRRQLEGRLRHVARHATMILSDEREEYRWPFNNEPP